MPDVIKHLVCELYCKHPVWHRLRKNPNITVILSVDNKNPCHEEAQTGNKILKIHETCLQNDGHICLINYGDHFSLFSNEKIIF